MLGKGTTRYEIKPTNIEDIQRDGEITLDMLRVYYSNPSPVVFVETRKRDAGTTHDCRQGHLQCFLSGCAAVTSTS